MPPTSGQRLRVALVWNGELMADHLAVSGAPITVGTQPGVTFVAPVTAVPDGHAIVRPDPGGWTLSLLDRDTPIRAGDVGVVPLADGIELFYQFVADDQRLPRSRSDLDLLTPALAFALLLHGVMLFTTYVFDEQIDPFSYPGSRRMIGEFLVQRVKVPPEPELERGLPAAATSPRPGGDENAGGGDRGGEPEAGTPTGKTAPPATTAPPRGLYTPRNRAVIEAVIGHDLTPSLGKFVGMPARTRGPGAPGLGDDPPGGTRPGPRIGPGGPGGPGPTGHPGPDLDVGPLRDRTRRPGTDPIETEVVLLPPTTDAPTLTHKEISDVVKSRAGLIRACYQRGADQRPNLAGALTVRFVIAADGRVTESKIDHNQSDLRDPGVESCVLRQINRLVFPAKGGGRVSYPFRFKQS